MTLCRERLARIQRVLNKNAGALTVRDFARSFSVWEWELEEAAALGWIQIETRKPRTGRPSRIVRNVSNPDTAKLPPYRWEIEKHVSHRHWMFALHSTASVEHGCRWIGIPCRTDAYQKMYSKARKRRAASASMSRLMRHPDVRACRAWFYASHGREIAREEPMPDTAAGIWRRLRELGSWRVRAQTIRVTFA